MVQFWKDVAMKAPHHSRASWMKYWRRHKHEFHHTERDDPIPPVPEKKMRYSRQDDVLLAQFFESRPTGTSDSIFQSFGRKVCVFFFFFGGGLIQLELCFCFSVSASSLERLAGTSSNT